ncbi:MAG TPA: BatA domain-containing protein [Luteolibacter sp.]|nr:BatA domain-containing protein [Luteolibacter sp.]
MLFLSPLFLWGLLAASVPVIIHLINRRRHQTIQWAAMQFLLKATRESRGKRKLRNILILACRCLILAGLAAAAAKPVISGLIGWGGGSIDTVVLLLDRSASMEVKDPQSLLSRRQIIIRQVRDTLDELGNPRLVLIDSATLQPQEVPSPDVLEDLSTTAATDTAADVPAMLNRAVEWLRDGSGNVEVWLASDLQASNWKSLDEGWVRMRAGISSLAKAPRLRVLGLTGNTMPNTSIRVLSSRRIGKTLQLGIQVDRGGNARGPQNIEMTTQLNGAATTESIILPEQSLQFQKQIPLEGVESSGFGWISIPSDGNDRDNTAFFAYGPAYDRTTLVVAPEGEAADYLALMSGPPGLDGFAVKRVTPEAAGGAISPELAAVVWAAPLPSGNAAEALKQFVAGGGQLMLLPPGESPQAEWLGISWQPLEEAVADKYFILGDWDHEDGLLRDGMDGTALAGKRLKAIRRQVPVGEITPLARWESGEAALTRKVHERGIIWCLGSLPDYTWSNLGDADVLLPALQRMIIAGADRFDQGEQKTIATGPASLPSGTLPRRVDSAGTHETTGALHLAGIYQINGRYTAYNRPESEDVAAVLGREELKPLFGNISYSMLGEVQDQGDSPLSQDAWRFFLIAALLFLIAEAILCLPGRTEQVVIPERSIT